MEREKLVLDVELQDQTAPAVFYFNGEKIEPNERVEIKNLGGGKHQLVFNKVEMTDDGEIMCESGQLTSSCKLTVKKGESKPIVDFPDRVEGPCSAPLVFVVPFKSNPFISYARYNKIAIMCWMVNWKNLCSRSLQSMAPSRVKWKRS